MAQAELLKFFDEHISDFFTAKELQVELKISLTAVTRALTKMKFKNEINYVPLKTKGFRYGILGESYVKRT